jgi:hypothetical protein
MSGGLSSDAILAEDHPASAYPENQAFLSAAFRRFTGLLFNLSAIARVAASAVLTGGVTDDPEESWARSKVLGFCHRRGGNEVRLG